MSFKYTANTLKKMEQLFEEANFTIRYERGNFNSGYCILDERRVAVINKFLDMEGRINVLIEILPSLNVKEEELSTEMQKWYKTVQNANPGNNSVQSEIEA
ncbi:MAG: hypothetical protein H6550_10710 [Chitinophagales bacterium]|nr:hypothetical protein [Chitinophagales bacterium]